MNEVRPSVRYSRKGSLHWVRRSLGLPRVWTWDGDGGHGGRWLWIDLEVDGDVNGYSGLAGFSTGPEDAYSEGWRYVKPLFEFDDWDSSR